MCESGDHKNFSYLTIGTAVLPAVDADAQGVDARDVYKRLMLYT